MPLLLLAYGAMTVIGNLLVGRLADRHTITTRLAGTGLNIVFLAGFLIFTDLPPWPCASSVPGARGRW